MNFESEQRKIELHDLGIGRRKQSIKLVFPDSASRALNCFDTRTGETGVPWVGGKGLQWRAQQQFHASIYLTNLF